MNKQARLTCYYLIAFQLFALISGQLLMAQVSPPNVQYYWDSDNTLTIQELLNGTEELPLARLEKGTTSFIPRPQTLWLRVEIPKDLDTDSHYLVINNPLLHHVSFYLTQEDRLVKSLQAGALLDQDVPWINSRQIAFSLLSQGELHHSAAPMICWVKIIDDEELRFPVKFWSSEDLQGSNDTALLGVGILLALLGL
ncbi:MAG: 7TM-DISM domain-containing protein, partial [Bacteroidota bacterium]